MRLLIPLLALAVAVIFHELGHWLFARVCGVSVPEFSIGFGPRLLSRRVAGTRWILRAIPLGAAARVQGMHVLTESAAAPGGGAPPDWTGWQRLLVLLGGSLFNVFVAYTLLFFLYCLGTHVPVPLTIGTIQPQSEAARAHLLPGDVLVSLDGVPLESWSAFTRGIAQRGGRPSILTLRRDGHVVSVGVEPEPDESGPARLGVGQQYRFGRLRWTTAAQAAAHHVVRVVQSGTVALFDLLRGAVPVGRALAAVSRESDAVTQDVDALLRLFVGLSLALAMFQLVPLPSLDGGRLGLLLLEWITRRRIPPRWEVLLHAAGLFAWLGLVGWLLMAQLSPLFKRAHSGFERPPGAVDGGR